MRQPARARILDAAYELLRTQGLARTTTKEIARTAACSEAALYKYFRSKEELFVAVLGERLPDRLLATLATEPAAGATVADDLVEIVHQAAAFYRQSFPLAMSIHAEPGLAHRHGAALREIGQGPHRPIEDLDARLRAARDAGRIRADADTYAAAAMLLGACAQRAFAYAPLGDVEAPQSDEEFAAALVRTLLAGLT